MDSLKRISFPREGFAKIATLWRSLRHLFQIIRPVNVLLLFVGAWVGGILEINEYAFSPPYYKQLLIAALSAALIGSGANALNDYFDISIDAINKPSRPLPSRKLSPTLAWHAGWLLLTLGWLLSLSLSSLHVLVASLAILLSYLYNRKLKHYPLVGNGLVAALVALGILYGSLTTGLPEIGWIGSLFAFLVMFIRELIKDAEDINGDRAAQLHTFPIAYGIPATCKVLRILILITLFLTPFPYLLGLFSAWYLLFIGITDGLLWYIYGALFLKNPPDAHWATLSLAAKLGAIAGIIALTTGRLTSI